MCGLACRSPRLPPYRAKADTGGIVRNGCFSPAAHAASGVAVRRNGLTGPLLTWRWAMGVPAVPATVTVACDAQLADLVFVPDRANSDFVLFQRRAAEIEELSL